MSATLDECRDALEQAVSWCIWRGCDGYDTCEDNCVHVGFEERCPVWSTLMRMDITEDGGEW